MKRSSLPLMLKVIIESSIQLLMPLLPAVQSQRLYGGVPPECRSSGGLDASRLTFGNSTYGGGCCGQV